MINLRYHIVSLVAVFLALAIGVIAGTTVVDQTLVHRLEGEQQGLEARTKALNDENRDLKRELALWDSYGRSLLVRQMRGRLQGSNIVLLLRDGVDGALLGDVEAALEEAGASLSGKVTFTDKWRLESQPAREQLALALGLTQTDGAELLTEAGVRLGARLAVSADPSQDQDLLQTLARAGFLALDDLAGGAFPPSGSLGLLVAAGPEEAPEPGATMAISLLRGVRDRMPFAVSEPLGASESLVERVRGDGTLVSGTATVDHVDTLIGRYSLVAALQALAQGIEAPHYGVRRRADAIAPGLEDR